MRFKELLKHRLKHCYSAELLGRSKCESSDLSLCLKLAKLSADRVFRDSEFHAVGAAMVKAREATEVSCSGR